MLANPDAYAVAGTATAADAEEAPEAEEETKKEEEEEEEEDDVRGVMPHSLLICYWCLNHVALAGLSHFVHMFVALMPCASILSGLCSGVPPVHDRGCGDTRTASGRAGLRAQLFCCILYRDRSRRVMSGF